MRFFIILFLLFFFFFTFACGVNQPFLGGEIPKTRTLHNLFCNKFFRPGQSKCRSHPGTGCTLRTSGRLHATPGRETL